MSNTHKIIEGIRQLTHKPHELVSGTVVPGSVDTTEYTCSIRLTHMDDTDTPLANVRLSAVTENGNGVIRIPADGSNVVVGSISGRGEYFLVQCSDLVKQITTIDNTVLTITATGYSIVCGDESLTKILNDLLTALIQLTVETPAGNSSVPVNVSDLTDIQTRITNLLT